MNAVTLITGASRGIGRGIALELAALGSDLVLGYVQNLSAARQTAADCLALAERLGRPVRIETCRADISQSRSRQRLIDYTKSEFQRLDVLVNNAGVAPE